MKKWLLFSILLVYLIAPFASGVLNYWHPRGPEIYNGGYHFWLHRMGASLAGHGRSYDVIYERPWFYGGPKIRSKIFIDKINKYPRELVGPDSSKENSGNP